MIPPKGFVAATNYFGFLNKETGSSITVSESSTSAQSIIDGFTTGALKPKGIILQGKEIVDFNKSKAVLLTLRMTIDTTVCLQQILVFEDKRATISVNGIYQEANKNKAAEIKTAMLSTVYNELQDENPLGAATFTFDTKDSEFKLVKFMSGSLFYSIDGKIPTEKPTLRVGHSLANVPLEFQKRYIELLVKRFQKKEYCTIKSNNKIVIDELEGCEIVVEGKSVDGKPEMIYQVMFFNKIGDYFIIIGQTKEDFPKYLEAFKKIATTFRQK